MKKRLITILSGIAIMSTMVGCTSTGYNAEQRDMDLGIEVMKQQMEEDESNLIESFGRIVYDMKDTKAEDKIDEAKTPKQSDDMIYGMLTYARDELNKVETISSTQFIEEFNYEEADIEDIDNFKEKVTPIYKDMANVLNSILNDQEFNGVVKKEDFDKFMKLYDEYYVYYKSYDNKVMNYKYN